MYWIYVLVMGALMAAAGVGAGAFGAHALKNRLDVNDLAIYETAIKYWMYHSLGLCIVSLVMTRIENIFMKLSASSIFFGALIFSGTLIALVLSGNRMLGAVTPVGGVLLIVGWVFLAVGVLSH